MFYYGGNYVINGTSGDDVIIAVGSEYIINGLGGNDTILAAYGDNETVTDTGGYDYVVLGGTGDSVTIDNGIITGTVTNATITFGAGKVDIGGNGFNTVKSRGSNLTISALGGNTTITALAGSITIDGVNNTVSTGIPQGNYAFEGVVAINGGTGSGTFNLVGTAGTLVTGGQYNTVHVNYSGVWDITPGSGNDTVSFAVNTHDPSLTGDVHLAGQYNTVSGYATSATISGGTGNNTVTMNSDVNLSGSSRDIELPGLNNAITLTNGVSYVDAGEGSDTVSIDGGYATLVFRGSGDMLLLDDLYPIPMGMPTSASVAVTGTHDGLQVFLGNGGQFSNFVSLFTTADIYSFGGSDVLHIIGGGGFTSTAAVVAALQPDGGGGFSLSLTDGFVHFDAGSHLTAANFALS